MPNFLPRRLNWTREHSARLWDYRSAKGTSDDEYFSSAVGAAVVRYARRQGLDLASGRVLDFGCGPGYLLGHLCDAGFSCEGADFSAGSVHEATRRLEGRDELRGVSQIEGVPTSLAEGSYDVIFLIETIEHLIDGDLEATLAELNRLLKPGGAVMITTPNDEPVERSEIMCPDCGCQYHRIQHVRRWTARSLSVQLAQFGFDKVSSEALMFPREGPKGKVLRAGFKVAGRPEPHLVYVGRKRVGVSAPDVSVAVEAPADPPFEPRALQWNTLRWERSRDHRIGETTQERPNEVSVGWPSLASHLNDAGIPITGRVLDACAGDGSVTEHLTAGGATVWAAEPSERLAKLAARRLQVLPGTTGPAPLSDAPDSAFDLALLLGEADRMPDEELNATLAEVRRALGPEGRFVVTAANAPNLPKGCSRCPSCGAEFQASGRVRSFSESSLAERLEASGFATVRCDAIYPEGSKLRRKAFEVAGSAVGLTPPRLVWIGRAA